MSLDIAKCPLGVKSLPVENHLVIVWKTNIYLASLMCQMATCSVYSWQLSLEVLFPFYRLGTWGTTRISVAVFCFVFGSFFILEYSTMNMHSKQGTYLVLGKTENMLFLICLFYNMAVYFRHSLSYKTSNLKSQKQTNKKTIRYWCTLPFSILLTLESNQIFLDLSFLLVSGMINYLISQIHHFLSGIIPTYVPQLFPFLFLLSIVPSSLMPALLP